MTESEEQAASLANRFSSRAVALLGRSVLGEFPNLVVSNLVVCKFYAEVLFCALVRSFLRVSVSDCVKNDRLWELQNSHPVPEQGVVDHQNGEEILAFHTQKHLDPGCGLRSPEYGLLQANREEEKPTTTTANLLIWCQNLNTFLFSNLSGAPGIPAKIPGSMGFEEHTELFGPPPLDVEDPYPTGKYLNRKVWVCAPFSCLISKSWLASEKKTFGDGSASQI